MRRILLVIFLFLHYSLFAQVVNKTSYLEELPVTCPESWTIDDEVYLTNGTWIKGRKNFLIKIFLDTDQKNDSILKVKAKKVALFAVKKGFYHNALKFNSINRTFNLGKKIIVSFVDGDSFDGEEDENPEYFTFDTDSLKPDSIEQIKLPEPLNAKEIKFLEAKLKKYYSSNDFKGIYNLMGPRAKSQIPYVEVMKNSENLKNIIGSVQSVSFDDFIYIGDKDGIKGYEMLFKVSYHNRFLRKKTEGRIILTIINHEPEYEIYEIKFVVNKSLF